MPASSEKQRRFMMSELGRAKRGEKTQTGMSTSQLSDYKHLKPGAKRFGGVKRSNHG